MQQYFVNDRLDINIMNNLDKDQAHHIINVMRMKTNDLIRVVDVDSKVFLCKIHISDREVNFEAIEAIKDASIMNIKVTLIQSLIKKDKWDFLLQKTSELGVDCIVPLQSKYCVVKLNDDANKKVERWSKICTEAAEQSKRSTLVKVEQPIKLSDISLYKSDLNIIAYEAADIDTNKLSSLLLANPQIKSVTYIVGCEGGFAKEEVEYANSLGFINASLGGRILRAETAAIYLLSATNFFIDIEGENDGKNN
ncbi:MAG: 16S rRNA (uracil(1498)-N(3))-methyltransferase [Erysipelotrichaceae bacterium]